MLSANISNAIRRSVYARDGYRCALCDSAKYIQIHHAIKRSNGGTNSRHNLICLCADCHAMAHGINLNDWEDITPEHMEQAAIEYLADYYAPNWNPWERDEPLKETYLQRCECYIHSLRQMTPQGEKRVLATATIIKKLGDNDYLADYNGVRCHAIYNPFTGHYYVDDVYGRVDEGGG